MRSCVNPSVDPWRLGAAHLAGLHDMPPDFYDPSSDVRRAARIILIENRIRRSRGREPVDYMSVRDRADGA